MKQLIVMVIFVNPEVIFGIVLVLRPCVFFKYSGKIIHIKNAAHICYFADGLVATR